MPSDLLGPTPEEVQLWLRFPVGLPGAHVLAVPLAPSNSCYIDLSHAQDTTAIRADRRGAAGAGREPRPLAVRIRPVCPARHPGRVDVPHLDQAGRPRPAR